MRKTGNRRERGAKTTIVRRQIKKNHAGHHGGAWKVAFADFTLAMMALFMTLWIVNSVSKSERALSPRCTGSRFLTVVGCRR